MNKPLYILFFILFIIKSNETSNLRYLGIQTIEGNCLSLFKEMTILGQKVKFMQNITIENGKISDKILIITDSGEGEYGYGDLSINSTKSVFQQFSLMKFSIPQLPDVILTLKGVGNINHQVKHEPENKYIIIETKGTIYANVDYDFGGNYNSLSAGGKGVLINLYTKTKLNYFIHNGHYFYSYFYGETNRVSGGKVNIQVLGKTIEDKDFNYDYELIKPWE